MITHSETIAKLAADLCKAQAALTNPAKDAVANIGPGRSYHYALLSSISDHVRPVLGKHNLAISQHVNGDPGVLRVTTMLLHASGEYLASDATITLPANVTPQQLGSAVTYLRRYGVQAVLGIAAEDDDDGAAASQAPHNGPQTAARPQAAPQANTTPRAPQAAATANTPTTTFTAGVVDVATKSGTSQQGRAWTVYRVEFDNGAKASTFSTTIGQLCQSIAGTGEGITVEVKPSRDGKGTDLVSARTFNAEDQDLGF